jgi:hypothetical protein
VLRGRDVPLEALEDQRVAQFGAGRLDLRVDQVDADPRVRRAAVPPRIPADRSRPRRDTSVGDSSLSGTDSSNAANVA